MSQLARALLATTVLGTSVYGSSGHAVERTSAGTGAHGTVTIRVHDGDGKLVPARVRSEPVGLGKQVDRLFRSHPRSHISDDPAAHELEPGAYRFTVSRGPRHTVAELLLEVGAGSRQTHDVVLVEQVPLPEHTCADLHVHTAHSDDAREHGGVTASALSAEGLDLTIATDHNAVNAIRGGLPALSGVEVTTWNPEVGHFNAFPVTSAPRHAHTSPRALFAALHAQPGVFVQINHPRLDDHIAYFTLGGLADGRFDDPAFSVEGADGVEVFNGYDIARSGQVFRVLDDVAALWERGHRISATGGSDSHGKPGHLPGYPRTCVRTRDAAAFAGTLARGDAFVTNGPMLDLHVQGEPPGSTVVPDGDGMVAVQVDVRAHPLLSLEEVEIWAGTSVVQRVPWQRSADGIFQLTARFSPGDARSIHARVRGGAGLSPFVERRDAEPLAFTNPVFLQDSKLALADRPSVGR